MIKYIIGLFLLSIITLIAPAQDSLNSCLYGNSYHIVILGSSTAAGSGPSTADSAWVNRYRLSLQNINSNNSVTNLAIGGTTTYHIMPSWFIPPNGRPSPNNNNISQALALNADAIIVNMPSNDAANGFTTAEQLYNFQLIASVADSANIPIWICTTQPKTNLSSTGMQSQVDVRDSIFSIFGNNAIDFWTTIATPANTIDTLYDSGDGTHLNDAAHRLLYQRVSAKNILSHLYDTLQVEDHGVTKLLNSNSSICGDSNLLVSAIIVNFGTPSFYDIPINLQIEDLINSSNQLFTDTIFGGLATCVADTVSWTINTFDQSNLKLSSNLQTSNDTNFLNDFSDTLIISSLGHPDLVVNTLDTTIYGNSILLNAATSSNEIVWFDQQNGGQVLHIGNQFQTPLLYSNTEYFVQSVYGPLVFQNSIFTTATSNINWNGCMFDIIATDSIIIDSLRPSINSIGVQPIIAYWKNGSHKGWEQDSSAWNLWGVDTLNVINSGDFMMAHFGSISLVPGDTLGIYLHMEKSNAQLKYQSMSNEKVRITNELQIITGSGIGHTFGAVYFPRDWNGEVFYHYGFNPDGICHSAREKVSITVEGVGNEEFSNDIFKVYPNPSQGGITIETGSADLKRIEIMDINGKIIYHDQSTDRDIHINLNTDSGAYILRIIENKKIRTFKLLINQ